MRFITHLFGLGIALLLLACMQTPASGPGWTDMLADGSPSWRAWGGEALAPEWHLENGVLTLASAGGGDVTNGVIYSDFEMVFEWKVAPGGNSGVFYFADPAREDIPPYHSAPEYQILDNARHADGASPLTSAGAVYGLYPTRAAAAHPVSEWNRGRILARDGRVEHWLNGERVAAYDLTSGAFRARVGETKFAEWDATFARAPSGLIVLQDHGDIVSYRNLRIRRLD